MGAWRSVKTWIKRKVLGLFLRFARTRFMRYVRKIVRLSAIPVGITCGAAVVGAGVASAVAFSVGFGALIGAGIGATGLIIFKLYQQHAANIRETRRLRFNYTFVRSNKDNYNSSPRRARAAQSPRRF